MNAIETPKQNSSIETAVGNMLSSILLSHLTPWWVKLKSEVSKVGMNLNGNILPNRIYVDADTNVL